MRSISVILLLVIVITHKALASEGVIDCTGLTLKHQRNFASGATMVHGSYRTCFASNIFQVSDLYNACESFIFNQNTTCATMKFIGIMNSTMLKLSPALFSRLPQLQMFYAANVSLMQIYRDDFEHAASLNELILSGNMIASLENGIISHLRSLNVLDLSNNKITALGEGTFAGASENLYELNLSGNKITTLEYTVFMPIAHRKRYPLELKMDNNEIKEVRESHKVHHLQFQSLSLKNNHISTFSCPDVTIGEVALDNNHLQSLSLDNCSIEYMSVPRNNLKFLHLHSELKGIIANHNQIKSIVVGEKSQIYQFEMAENEDLSQAFASIKTMGELKYLNVSFSHIGALHEDTFAAMKNLKYLFMKSCGLKVIPFELFVNNGHLLTLDIANNQLETMDLHMLTGLRTLNLLDVSGNKLSQIAGIENIKDVLPELKEVVIEGNPWKCIDLSTMLRTLKQLNIRIADAKKKNFGVQNILGIPCH